MALVAVRLASCRDLSLLNRRERKAGSDKLIVSSESEINRPVLMVKYYDGGRHYLLHTAVTVHILYWLRSLKRNIHKYQVCEQAEASLTAA